VAEESKENRLLNASIYLKNAILELKAIPCECGEEYCDRCCLVDDVVSVRTDIDDKLNEILKM
jgi:hypothetical protein